MKALKFNLLRTGSPLAALLLVAAMVAASGIVISLPLAAHPQGPVGYIAGMLAGWCSADAPCDFGTLYPAFVSFCVIVSTTIATLFISLHMSLHKFDPDLDEMDTKLCKTLDEIEKLRTLVEAIVEDTYETSQDLVIPEAVLFERLEKAGTRL